MIEMFLTKSNNKKLQLLREILNNNGLTIAELSKRTNISENSISKYISALNADLKAAKLKAVLRKNKQHHYYLALKDLSELVIYSKIGYFYGEQSASFKLCQLLVSEASITIDQICKVLYISKSYMYRIIAMTNELLKLYSIQLKIDKVYQLRFYGDELAIRVFVYHFFSQCIPSDTWIANYATKEEILNNIQLQMAEMNREFDYFETKKMAAFWQMMKYRLSSKNYLPVVRQEYKRAVEFYCCLSRDWIKRIFPNSKVMPKKIFETEYLYLNFFLRIFVPRLVDKQSMRTFGKK